MKICEIFHSIQGEGINAGKPAVFVRFFGCNLSCSWCDTKYSWHPKHAEWEEMSLEEVAKKVKSHACSHVIFTGGEPALFQKEIRKIVNALPRTFTYEIESNGTISLEETEDVYSVVNISPKLKNSGNGSALNAINKKYYYKFVVVDAEDISEIRKLRKKYDLRNIWLMPEGRTRKEQLDRSSRIVELCQRYGFEFSPRLQSLFWNGEKGK